MTILSPSHVLWTGFEPFGPHEYNPSWDVARAAAQSTPPVFEPEVERLPVEFDSVRRWASSRLTPATPTLAIHVGLAESRTTVDLEAIAHNEIGERPDEAGDGPRREVVVPQIDRAKMTTPFPLERLETYLLEALDLPELPEPSISENAGRFVCNALYFHSLRQLIGAPGDGAESASLFIHVPPLERRVARRLGVELGTAVGELFG